MLAETIYLLLCVCVCMYVFTTCIQLSLCRLQRHLLQDEMFPIAFPYVIVFQLSVSECVMACVMCHVKIMCRCSRCSLTGCAILRGSVSLNEVCGLLFSCVLCAYAVLQLRLWFFSKNISVRGVLIYKSSWTEFRSVSSAASEGPSRDKLKNIKRIVSIFFVVVLHYCSWWITWSQH